MSHDFFIIKLQLSCRISSLNITCVSIVVDCRSTSQYR